MRKDKESGATLFELIIVLVLFVIIAGVAAQIFFASIRGGNKSEAIALVKQEGSYAMSIMERGLHNARGIDDCDVDGSNKVNYRDELNTTTYFACESGSITSGSTTKKLTSDDTTVPSCSITCSPDNKTVIVSFTVSKDLGTGRVEDKAETTMNSRILLRN